MKLPKTFGSDGLAEMSVQRTDAILSPVIVRRVSLLSETCKNLLSILSSGKSGGNGLSHWFCCLKK